MGPTALFSWGLGIFLGKVVDIFSAIVRIDKARNKGDARKLSYLFLNPLSVFAIGKWKPIGNWGGVHAKRQAVSGPSWGGDYWNRSPIWSRVNTSGTGAIFILIMILIVFMVLVDLLDLLNRLNRWIQVLERRFERG